MRKKQHLIEYILEETGNVVHRWEKKILYVLIWLVGATTTLLITIRVNVIRKSIMFFWSNSLIKIMKKIYKRVVQRQDLFWEIKNLFKKKNTKIF